MAFLPQTVDYKLSPYTGLTRESWIEAGKYLLTGIFNHVNKFEDPLLMPRKETKITYPHFYSPVDIQKAERKAEIFEGLTRSFFIAAPLIHDEPNMEICGYSMRDYYKTQVLRACTKGDSIYVGNYEDLQGLTNYADPHRAFQQTVETCALVIGLWICKNEIWDSYSKEEKDRIAAFISSFAHANTVPQNWRMFNMLDLAFLNMEGYAIDREIMLDHAQAILNYYAGDGWYRDGHSFDYYSCWAFNVYAPLWNKWYGYENEPYIAKCFEENSNKLMESYADLFDYDGFTNMWGRSNIYRNATTSPFEANFYLHNPKVNPGLARRIASGSLLQFITREDFLYKGVPTLGFYGQFSPSVQGYSCATSPLWMGKAFLCLHLPKDHPYWTERENNGTWEKLHKDEVKETVLHGPALCFSNHEASGETILRTGKVLKNKSDFHGMWNYSKLTFNTKYPWEATPSNNPEIEAQQYVLKDNITGELQRGNATFWNGAKDGVLYRRQFFNYNLETEAHWLQALNLADFTVPYGIIRVDKMRLYRRPISLTLGAYGFPDNGTEIIHKGLGSAKAIILKGKDYTGREKQLAMTVYDGWEAIDYVRSLGTNPDSEKSIILYAHTESRKQYGAYEPYVLISQVITKESLVDFLEDELFPIAKIIYEDRASSGAYGNVTIELKAGNTKTINFEGMESMLVL